MLDRVLPSPEIPAVRFALLMEAFLLLVKHDLRAFGGFRALQREIDRPLSFSLGVDGRAQMIADMGHAVEKACLYYPKHCACLQRSMVLTSLMRRHGISAQLVIGVRQLPFESHAWVEADSRVINDVQRVRDTYQVLSRLGPT
jgi:hypothetical protein